VSELKKVKIVILTVVLVKTESSGKKRYNIPEYLNILELKVKIDRVHTLSRLGKGKCVQLYTTKVPGGVQGVKV
jgi:hypothetical protein